MGRDGSFKIYLHLDSEGKGAVNMDLEDLLCFP